MIDQYDALKAAHLAAAAAADPDTAARVERDRELVALERQRGYLSPDERAELTAIRRTLNEQARERQRAERAAARQAEADTRAAEQRAAGEQQRAQVRAEVLRTAPGLAGPALESAVDRILADRAAAVAGDTLAAKRRQLAGLI